MNTYEESARRGAQWIAGRQKPDGSMFEVEAGIGGYYKVPYALSVSGHVPAGTRLLRWVREHHFTAEGDFRGPSRKAAASVHDDWSTYENAWLIQGAHRLGQFDLSRGGAEFLLRYQTSCGGFHALANEKSYAECLGTSWSGLAELVVGNLQAAASAANCLERLVAGQPQADRFYFRMSPDGQLGTNVPEGEALAYYVDANRPKQIYFQPGISLIFLCRYHLATGEQSTLEAAQTIFDFTQRCAEDVYCFPPSGKLGLGCCAIGLDYQAATSPAGRPGGGRLPCAHPNRRRILASSGRRGLQQCPR